MLTEVVHALNSLQVINLLRSIGLFFAPISAAFLDFTALIAESRLFFSYTVFSWQVLI